MATKPMEAYAALLCRPEWQRKRLEIMDRDGYRCVQCKSLGEPGNYLQVDHKHYVSGAFPWEAPNRYLQTVCRRCHERLTLWRRRISELAGDMNIYELPLAIEMLEGFWGRRESVPEVPSAARLRTEATTKRLELIRGHEAEKTRLMDLEFTPARSRRVEELDELIDRAWAQVQEVA